MGCDKGNQILMLLGRNVIACVGQVEIPPHHIATQHYANTWLHYGIFHLLLLFATTERKMSGVDDKWSKPICQILHT